MCRRATEDHIENITVSMHSNWPARVEDKLSQPELRMLDLFLLNNLEPQQSADCCFVWHGVGFSSVGIYRLAIDLPSKTDVSSFI